MHGGRFSEPRVQKVIFLTIDAPEINDCCLKISAIEYVCQLYGCCGQVVAMTAEKACVALKSGCGALSFTYL